MARKSTKETTPVGSMLMKRVGTSLKEARESRKLTLKDVSRQTNITPRYLTALENEEYSAFPGETYALGFLRTYAEFLGLNVGDLLNLYHGHKIDQSQTPLAELTRPTSSLPALQLDRRAWMGIAGGAGLLLVIYLLSSGILDFSSNPADSAVVVDKADVACDDRAVELISIPQKGAAPRLSDITTSNALKFNLDTSTYKFCLERIELSPGGNNVAFFALRINEAANHRFRAAVNETTSLNASIPGLAGMAKEIQVTPRVIGDASVRIQMESGESGAAVSDQIQVTLQFVADSYFEWAVDGVSKPGTSVAAGQTRTLEARSRLEIKVGNGGGVQIIREGQPPRIAGPAGKIVKITYRKVPDALDPGIFRIQEDLEVAR